MRLTWGRGICLIIRRRLYSVQESRRKAEYGNQPAGIEFAHALYRVELVFAAQRMR